MGKFAKIAAALNVVAVICVLVALIVNVLSYYEGGSGEATFLLSYYEGTDGEVTYGATEYSFEYSGIS